MTVRRFTKPTTSTFRPRYPRLLSGMMVLTWCVAIMVTGCKGPVYPRAQIDRESGAVIEQPLTIEALSSTSGADVGTSRPIIGDMQRAPIDLRRACEELSWGTLKVEHRFATDERQPSSPHRVVEVRGLLLLPDGREAVVNILPGPKTDTLAATIRVGNFGSVAEESQWLAALAQSLSRKSRPDRGGYFELP